MRRQLSPISTSHAKRKRNALKNRGETPSRRHARRIFPPPRGMRDVLDPKRGFGAPPRAFRPSGIDGSCPPRGRNPTGWLVGRVILSPSLPVSGKGSRSFYFFIRSKICIDFSILKEDPRMTDDLPQKLFVSGGGPGLHWSPPQESCQIQI